MTSLVLLERTVDDLRAEVDVLQAERSALSRTIAELDQRIARVEGAKAPGTTSMMHSDRRPLVEQVLEMTREVFSGEVTFSEQEDREIPDDSHFTFNVVDSGELHAVLARNDQWHARICELPPAAHGLFRLSIDVR